MLIIRTASISLIAAIALTGCLTSQERSPIYDRPSTDTYSSAPATNTSYQTVGTYSATPVSHSAPVACPSGTVPHSSGCLLQDSAAASSPAGITANQAASFEAARTSAYTYYSAGPATAAPSAQNAAANIASTSAPNMVRAGAVTAPQYSREIITVPNTSAYQGASTYQVGSGDTVYSLARGLCVPVSEIQGANSLGADFGIQIGQSLTLPSSRC